MRFVDIYKREKAKPTPAQSFILRIARLTKKSENTVKMWVCGAQEPHPLEKEVIAQHFGLSAQELFPPKYPRQ